MNQHHRDMDADARPIPFSIRERALIACACVGILALATLVQWRVGPYLGGHDFGPWPDCLEYVAGAQSIADSFEYYVQVGPHRLQPRYNPGTSMVQALLLKAGVGPRELWRLAGIVSGAIGILLALASLWLATALGAMRSRRGRSVALCAALVAGSGWALAPIGLARADAGSDLLGALTANVSLLAGLFAFVDRSSKRAGWLAVLAGLSFGAALAIRTSGGVLLVPCLFVAALAGIAERGVRTSTLRGLALLLGAAVPISLTMILMSRSGWSPFVWSAYEFWVPEDYGPGARIFALEYAIHGHDYWRVPRNFGEGHVGNLELGLGIYSGLPLTRYLGAGWFWPLLGVGFVVLATTRRWREAHRRRAAAILTTIAILGWFAGHLTLYGLYFYPDDRFYLAPASLLFPVLCGSLAACWSRARSEVLTCAVLATGLMLFAGVRAVQKFQANGVPETHPEIELAYEQVPAWRSRSDVERALGPIPFDTVVAQACGLLPYRVTEGIGEWGRLTPRGEHAERLLRRPEFRRETSDLEMPSLPREPKVRFVPEAAREGRKLVGHFDSGSSCFVWRREGTQRLEYVLDMRALTERGTLAIGVRSGDDVATTPFLEADFASTRDGEAWTKSQLELGDYSWADSRLALRFVADREDHGCLLEVRPRGSALCIRTRVQVPAAAGTEHAWRLRALGREAHGWSRGPVEGVLTSLPGGRFASLLLETPIGTASRLLRLGASALRSPALRIEPGAGRDVEHVLDGTVWLTASEASEPCLPIVDPGSGETEWLASRSLLLGPRDEARDPLLESMGGRPLRVADFATDAGARLGLSTFEVRNEGSVNARFLAELAHLGAESERGPVLLRGSRGSALWRSLRFAAAAALAEAGSNALDECVARGQLFVARRDATGLAALSPAELRALLAGALPCLADNAESRATNVDRAAVELAWFLAPFVAALHEATRTAGVPEVARFATGLRELQLEGGLRIHANLSARNVPIELRGTRLELPPGGYLARAADGRVFACLTGAERARWVHMEPDAQIAASARLTPDEWRALGLTDAPAGFAEAEGFAILDLRTSQRWSSEAAGLVATRLGPARRATSLRLEPTAVELGLGRRTALLRLRARDAAGRPAPLPAAPVWSSSAPECVSVSATGIVRSRAPGSATIRVALPGTGLSAEAEIRVSLAPRILRMHTRLDRNAWVVELRADRPCAQAYLFLAGRDTAGRAEATAVPGPDRRSFTFRVERPPRNEDLRLRALILDEFGGTADALVPEPQGR